MRWRTHASVQTEELDQALAHGEFWENLVPQLVSSITVKVSGIDQLEKFASDLEAVLRRIDGKSFRVYVEPQFQASQIPRPMNMSEAMGLANEVIRLHHLRVFGRDISDGGAGFNEREFVKRFVGERIGISRPRTSRNLRKEAQQAFSQAQRILPGNRALGATQAALAGRRTFNI